MRQISILIEDMTCAACSARVEKALAKQPGVQSANVNLATGKASIKYDEKLVDTEQLVQAIENAGYTPRLDNTDSAELVLVVEGMT